MLGYPIETVMNEQGKILWKESSQYRRNTTPGTEFVRGRTFYTIISSEKEGNNITTCVRVTKKT